MLAWRVAIAVGNVLLLLSQNEKMFYSITITSCMSCVATAKLYHRYVLATSG